MEAVSNLLEARKGTHLQERIRISPGEVLIAEGEVDDTVYVLLSGGLRVSRNLDGEQTPITLITRPGSVVGEIVALGGGTRTATVEAREASELLAFSPGEFDSLLHLPIRPVTPPASAPRTSCTWWRDPELTWNG